MIIKETGQPDHHMFRCRSIDAGCARSHCVSSHLRDETHWNLFKLPNKISLYFAALLLTLFLLMIDVKVVNHFQLSRRRVVIMLKASHFVTDLF